MTTMIIVGALVVAAAAAAAALLIRQVRQEFRAASIDALDANGERFMRLARAEFAREHDKARGELLQRQQAIEQLIQPVTTKLNEVDARINAFDQARAKSAGELAGQIEALRQTGELLRDGTGALTRALREPQGRGRWGEMQLRRVVEMAGLSEHCHDFSTQVETLDDEGRRLRPDMLVQLPNGRCVVIDAKAPLDAYLSACEADDDASAAPHLARHAQQVLTHVKLLASKQYSRHVADAMPDFVVLFLPAEHLFAAAVRENPALIEQAFARNVVIASPTTLLTMLHAIAQGWKEERLAHNAAQIAELGRELHKRVATMTEHFASLGRHLDRATDAYNKTIGSLERQVLVSTRKFERLDAAAREVSIPEPQTLGTASRTMTAPELTGDELVGDAHIA